jgi:uncharacterized membrane protein
MPAVVGSFLFLRRQRNIPTARAAMTATPPTVPPTIGPIGVDLGESVWVADAEALLTVVETTVLDTVDEEVVCVAIVRAMNTKEPEDFDPSVAVANIVPISGVESQYQFVAGRFAPPITT